ncbi:MAG: hypothetical protein AAB489_00805 [Patescibacteria group bacterium]
MGLDRAPEPGSEAKRILKQGYDGVLERKIDAYYDPFTEDDLTRKTPAISKEQFAAVVQRVNELRVLGVRGAALERVILMSSEPLVSKNFPIETKKSYEVDPFFTQRYVEGTLRAIQRAIEMQSGNGLPDVTPNDEPPQESDPATAEGTRSAAQRIMSAGSQFRLPG